MVVEFYAIEMQTGRKIGLLPTDSGSWSIATNADDSITCEVLATSLEAATFDIGRSTPVARTGLLAVVDNVPVAAGPIWKRSYTQGGSVTFTAGGLLSYWARRILLPVGARGQALVDPVTGEPVTTYDTNLSGLSYGTIVKRWIELVRAWPGGAVPMLLPADESGGYERNVAAIDLKRLRTLIDNIVDVENGPDIAFRPRWSDDGLGIYWEYQHGSVARPRLGQTDASLVRWTVGAQSGGAFNLSVEEDGTSMAEEVFAGGGRADDRTLIAQARNATLFDAGYPLLQDVDTSHSDVVRQDTMQGYANQGAKLGRYAASFWKMSVRAHEAGSPSLGDYWLNDMATITVDPKEPFLGAERAYDVQRRIASISGDHAGESFDLAFAESLA